MTRTHTFENPLRVVLWTRIHTHEKREEKKKRNINNDKCDLTRCLKAPRRSWGTVTARNLQESEGRQRKTETSSAARWRLSNGRQVAEKPRMPEKLCERKRLVAASHPRIPKAALCDAASCRNEWGTQVSRLSAASTRACKCAFPLFFFVSSLRDFVQKSWYVAITWITTRQLCNGYTVGE